MKKLILLLLDAVTCVIFTACSSKPDEEVVIPDGLYEETAHLVRYDIGEWGNYEAEILAKDSVYVTQVLIDRGEFIYQGMCSDTFHVGLGAVCYRSSFIYLAKAYCSKFVQDGTIEIGTIETNPVRVSSDGFVVIPAPQFSDFSDYDAPYSIDSDYVYRARVSEDGGAFYFEQNHEFVFRVNRDFSYKYHIEHTLRRL